MTTKRRTAMPRRRSKWLWTLLLCLALSVLIAGSALARTGDQGEVADPATAKPVVTLQGNLVKEKGKATGFYELALCVRSGCIVTDDTGLTGVAPGTKIDQTVFWDYIDAHPEDEDKFTVQYYPFRTASAAVYVNTDVLTAVNWDIQKVTYAGYTAGTGYDAPYNTGYPMGINTDPAVQGYTIPEALAFPDITGAFYNNRIAIDVEGDPRMGTIMGLVEHYDDIKHTALVTLAAHAPDTDPVILKQPTELVVARFAYDLNRYKAVEVDDSYLGSIPALRNSVTGDSGDVGFWMGWDKSHKDATAASKTDLTWLGESTGTFDFSGSDGMIASTQADQSVWVHMGANAGTLQDDETYFYYYLGAEVYKLTPDAEGTIFVDVGNPLPAQVDHVALPDTEGATVLTKGKDQNPVPGGSDTWTQADYTYFRNLLRLQDKTLVLKLVNQPTFKKPTGGFGGTQVLFYDWDDTLIGAMIVGDGDVRAEVNAYIEENMVHPDLRTGTLLDAMGGDLPTGFDTMAMPASGATADADRYKGIVDSLEREWTYRGKYPIIAAAKGDTTGVVSDGEEYPLTNKLDYAFYRHVDTVTTLEYVNAGGTAIKDRYVTSNAVSSDLDAALYPWVYGWAVVEDNSAANVAHWTVRRDAAKVEDTWTTVGVGELKEMNPAYDLTANTKSQNVPAALPSGTSPAPGTTLGGGSGIEALYPAFVDTSAITAGPSVYSYKLSSADSNGYLRFADFSAVDKELTKPGQNVLVVKAVYEPGKSLFTGGLYQMISEPYYNKLNGAAAAGGGAYSVEITLERATDETGTLRGVNRVRQPAVRQDTTIDQKWIQDKILGVDHNLDNASVTTAQGRTETTYTKVDADNGEQIAFTLALSARQNKVDYFLMEMYGYNFVSGTTRSSSNYDRYKLEHTIDNYYYLTDDAARNDGFFDKQNLYYQAVRYNVREGTHGFVLYGTLNHLMQQATMVNRGELSTTNFNSNAVLAAFNDANLRLDTNGSVPTTGADQTTVRNALKAAAADCAANKTSKSGDVWDYWDYEHDCAQLTYHQLQYYILNSALIPRSKSEDLIQTHFDWCHLHIDCFDDKEAEVLPSNWSEIITAARGDNDAQNTIGKINLDKLKDMTYLRADAAGGAYATSGAMQTAIVNAVKALDFAGVDVNWATVQDYIITGRTDKGAAEAATKADYWWYDGATSLGTPGSLSALVSATDDYFNTVTLKDGTSYAGGFTAKLAQVESVFNSNVPTPVNEPSAAWIKMTRNLVKSYVNYDNVYDTNGDLVGTDWEDKDGTGETTKFDNYSEFYTYWIDFQTMARGISLPASHPQYWELLQYYILHTVAGDVTVDAAKLQDLVNILGDSSDPDHATLMTELNGYWWKDGGKRLVVSSIGTLLKAARQVNDGGDSGPLDKVDMALLESLYLRGSKTGQTFASLGMTRDQVIDLVKDAAKLYKVSGDPTSGYLITDWDGLQYYIAHGAAAGKDDMAKEAVYYWWKKGGTGTVVNVAGGSDPGNRIQLLMQAIIRGTYYGDPKALSSYTDPTKIFGDLALLERYPDTATTGITLGADGMPEATVDAATRQKLEFTSMNDLISALSSLMTTARGIQGITEDYVLPTVDWTQTQYAILNSGAYLTASGAAGSPYMTAYGQYWWYSADEYIVSNDPDPEPTEALMAFVQDRLNKANGITNDTNLKNKIPNTGVWLSTYGLRKNAKGDTVNNATAGKNVLVKMATEFKADIDAGNTTVGTKDGSGVYTITATWAQVQYYFATSYPASGAAAKSGTITSNADALKHILTDADWQWTKEDTTGSRNFIPKEVDITAAATGLGEPVIVVIPGTTTADGLQVQEGLIPEEALSKVVTTNRVREDGALEITTVVAQSNGSVAIVRTVIFPDGTSMTTVETVWPDGTVTTQTPEEDILDGPAEEALSPMAGEGSDPAERDELMEQTPEEPEATQETRDEREETPAGEDAHVRGEAPAQTETPAALGEALATSATAAPAVLFSAPAVVGVVPTTAKPASSVKHAAAKQVDTSTHSGATSTTADGVGVEDWTMDVKFGLNLGVLHGSFHLGKKRKKKPKDGADSEQEEE